MNQQGVTRLQKEYKAISQNKSQTNFVVSPDPKNIFEWHFVIYNLQDSPYEGGYYHGKLLFPVEYPMKPPGIIMLTPSGRFEPKKRICLSISDYHPETWNPVWNASTILIALLSFMNSDENTTGCVLTSTAQKRSYAKMSLSFNMKDQQFKTLFKPLFSTLGIEDEKIKESQEFQKKKQESDNKKQFIILSVICLVAAYLIAMKFS